MTSTNQLSTQHYLVMLMAVSAPHLQVGPELRCDEQNALEVAHAEIVVGLPRQAMRRNLWQQQGTAYTICSTRKAGT